MINLKELDIKLQDSALDPLERSVLGRGVVVSFDGKDMKVIDKVTSLESDAIFIGEASKGHAHEMLTPKGN